MSSLHSFEYAAHAGGPTATQIPDTGAPHPPGIHHANHVPDCIYLPSICQSKSLVTFPHKLAPNCDFAMAQDKEIGCTIWDPGECICIWRWWWRCRWWWGGSGNPKVSVNCAFFFPVCCFVCLSICRWCSALRVWPSVWFFSLCLFSLHWCLIISLDLCYANWFSFLSSLVCVLLSCLWKGSYLFDWPLCNGRAYDCTWIKISKESSLCVSREVCWCMCGNNKGAKIPMP